MNPNVPINTLTWLCTHNAFNNETDLKNSGAHGGGGSNQNFSIIAQLNAGVRALMIDVHWDANAPRVRHVGALLDHDLPYEDLCDLLIQLRQWLDQNTDQVVILLMEVTGDVQPEVLRDTFAGAGPVQRNQYYDLRGLIYTHPPGSEWPSITKLCENNSRLVVFRETDDGKGRIKDDSGKLVSGLDWYHDMWEHWLETPYSNTPNFNWNKAEKQYWNSLQQNTYILSPQSRGNREKASFFNLNHFVDSQSLAVGSAGVAAGINTATYLQARALIAWKMQGRRPSISIDFFDSADTTRTTADYLNNLPTIQGSFKLATGALFKKEITWEGITQLAFTDHLGATYLDWTIDPILHPAPTSRHGEYCFPADTKGATMTLTPKCPGFSFSPPAVTWDGASSITQAFTVTPIQKQLHSGRYTLSCQSEGVRVYLSTAIGEYAFTRPTDAQAHEFVRVGGGSAIVGGDKIYIRSTEKDLMGHYLHKANNLKYEGGNSPTEDHMWRIKKVMHGGPNAETDHHIYVGDAIALEHVGDANSYMSAKGIEDYVNLTDQRVPIWTVEEA